MAFRPAGTLLFCISLTIFISIICGIILHNQDPQSNAYSITMAILTGVVASGLVSISIELANNYRHNRQRFVVLNEYLYIISSYERLVEMASYGDYQEYSDDYNVEEKGRRLKAITEVIGYVAPVVERAVKEKGEYLSIKELQMATRAIDAAEKVEDAIRDVIRAHMSSRQYLDVLSEPLRTKIKEYSDYENMRIIDDDLEIVVSGWCLSHLDELTELDDDEESIDYMRSCREVIIGNLRFFDEAMHRLQSFAKMEPVMYENLISFDVWVKKAEKELFGKEYQQ